MLTLVDLTKSFGEKIAVEKLNLTINKGEVVALLGPNGAGKTTLMRMITGYLTPSSGKILWDGKKVDPDKVSYKSKIGYLPENNPLYTNLTVKEFLKFTATIKDVKNVAGEVDKVGKMCGLAEVMKKKIEVLSKGYKQRCGIAAVLLGDPQLLILDEPTSGLDPNQIIEIRELIASLAKKRSVLLSTHILPEAMTVASRVIIINRGKIVLDKEKSSVKNIEKTFITLTQ